ncbi:MAG TPA: sigma-70 family RNA polymerase sigma factor [Gemmatimonadaceae bacterium]|nr:sigma-70 family RNA polymerase sigma factor [Gemmatimonadaceae bacterium]
MTDLRCSDQAPPALSSSVAPQPVSYADFELMLRDALTPAYGVAFRLTGNRQDAEDLVQQAALSALRSRHTFRLGSNFKAWFFKIVMNHFYTAYRRYRPVSSIQDVENAHEMYLFEQMLDAGFIQQPDPVQATLDKLATEDVTAALASLPDEFRTVCTMYLMDDFSYEEIAEMLGIPLGTVRSRLHRGRRMLQKRLWKLAVDQGIVPAGKPTPQTGEER